MKYKLSSFFAGLAAGAGSGAVAGAGADFSKKKKLIKHSLIYF